MDHRDQIALAAMQSFLATPKACEDIVKSATARAAADGTPDLTKGEAIAQACYYMADCMLKARE